MLGSSLGARVRQLRKEKGLSQAVFAQLIGISQTFLSEIERDVAIPGGEVLLALKRSCGVSLDWLTAGEVPLIEEGAAISGELHALSNAERTELESLRQRVESMAEEVARLRGKVEAYEHVIRTFKGAA